ncbi:MAG TPA: hypothetical protein VHQ90_16815 [Thermoanaerobaculia bacterium]|nr:hypothetical protein [Thermoanaerobaculia bacterium]
MQEKLRKPASLNLEVHEIERHIRPGCQNSTTTSPRCTCPPPLRPRS